ncbi:MAG: zinc-ribbon domain-containing protein [archaeon]|nr:zinc-ribbon domain-containing protein [archaeon]
MFFGKKIDKNPRCSQCNSKIDDSFSFCPYCGESLVDAEQEMRDFGMLGRMDSSKRKMSSFPQENFGITDKFLNSMISSLTKTLAKQFNEANNTTEIENFPNGIKIRIGQPAIKKKIPKTSDVKKAITEEQIKKMSGLPRAEAKTNIRRFSDKVIYEMTTPGLESIQDVFISKLESGYEIKAIGNKKVYINSLPINLPLRGYALEDGLLLIEFKIQER